ncbi:hypothetical protein FAK_40280 [Desulfoferula mesophila]|uniref:Transposase n=1 Tax=Desulfoferula mesophila TaxID=3058419 RepID=A0AAU9F5G7_9BACT|nr:hypothetical protein FAK_40280 [Desulfoferula mesophilus]
MSQSEAVEGKVREIRRKTRRKYSAEEKIRIVLEGLRGEESIAELCRREGIAPNLYYSWSKEFLEAGKRRMMGDTMRITTSLENMGKWMFPSKGGRGMIQAQMVDVLLNNLWVRLQL